jgi:RimJ/RimL family protein N-acetyltransferase
MLPLFETDRLILRPRTIDDLEASLALDRDPEVVRYVAGPWSDPPRHRQFVLDRINHPYPSGMGYWVIAEKTSPSMLVGWILLIPCDAVGPDIEIGWRFIRAIWGKGYATEAARTILRHGFETLGLERVIAEIDTANARSLRVAEKLGLKPIHDDGVSADRRYRVCAINRDLYYAVTRDAGARG